MKSNSEKFIINAKVKKIDKDIKKAIKKAGIEYPHHSLAFFKATYAKFEEANGNKVILADSVKADVPFLIGCQMNRDHMREGAIMGSIIDAYVTANEEIEIIFTFAKNVYPKDYELALDLMKEDKLTVSFELMVDKKDVENVKGGNRRLKKVFFDGVGLLFGIKPAYKNAYVLETAMRIIEEAFNQDDKKLVYASAKDIASKWTRIGELIEKALIENNTKGESKMDKETNEALLARQKEIVIEEFGEEAVKDWSDEDYLNQDKIDALRASLKVSEEKSEDKKEDKSVEASEDEASKSDIDKSSEEKVVEEKEEEVAVKTVMEEDVKVNQKVTYDDETNQETVVTESERVVKHDGEVKVEEKTKNEVTYTYAQVEEIKAEYEVKIQAKEKEIEFLKENAKKVVEIRTELGDFVKDLSDEDVVNEDKLEKARLQKRVAELEAKDKSIETAEEKESKDDDLKIVEEGKEEDAKETKEERVEAYLKTKYGKK
jgi:hypothetical protein